MSFRLPPEWYPQDAIMLTWPHADTDWAPYLSEVEPVYIAIAKEVLKRQSLVLVCHNEVLQTHVQNLLSEAGVNAANLYTVPIPCNDTWARDHGPLTVINKDGDVVALDFIFNGWGGKYESDLDNCINEHLMTSRFIQAKRKVIDMVLEGGGIEVDDNGHLLTTEQCLLNPNRNPELNRQQIESKLNQVFGTTKVLWLKEGELDGDDTDAHIDTLARFAPNNTIVYVQCSDKNDEHYDSLKKMEQELKALRTQTGDPFNLVSLPFPSTCLNEDGERLPATYANFLVINGAVLFPTYRQPDQDQHALVQCQQAFPELDIIAIDCLPLIHQFGSLHCISMQLPKGFLA